MNTTTKTRRYVPISSDENYSVVDDKKQCVTVEKCNSPSDAKSKARAWEGLSTRRRKLHVW